MKNLCIILLFFLFTNAACAPDSQAKSELEEQIIGTWHHEGEPESKIAFYQDGTVERYNGDELISKNKYKITKECNGESLTTKQVFL